MFVSLFSILVSCGALSIINIVFWVKHTAEVAVPTQVVNFSRLRTWYLFNVYSSKGYGMNRSAIKMKLLSEKPLEIKHTEWQVNQLQSPYIWHKQENSSIPSTAQANLFKNYKIFQRRIIKSSGTDPIITL